MSSPPIPKTRTPEDRVTFARRLRTALRTGAPGGYVLRKYDIPKPPEQGGGFEERYWSATSSPLLNAAGEVTHILHQVEDVTELARLRQRTDEQGMIELELRRSADWFSTTLASIGDAVIATDEAGRVKFMNGVAEALTGWNGKEAAGKSLEEVFRIVNEKTEVPCESPVERVLRSGLVVGLANHTVLIARDGSRKSIDDSAAPIKDARGQIIGVVLVFRDVSARKEAEKAAEERNRLASLDTDIGFALTRSNDLRDMLGHCAKSLVRRLDAAFARIWTVDAAGAVLELQASAGMYTHLDGSHGRVPVGQFKIGLIAAERTPQLTNPVIGDPRVPEQEWAAREGLVSFAGYPLVVADRLVGVMAMFARRPLTEAVLQAMTSVADEIALGIDHKRAGQELRESEALKTAILNSAIDGVITIDHEGKVIEFNPAAEKTFGRARAEVLGREIDELIIPTHLRERHRQGLARCLATGEGPILDKRIEMPALRADGSFFPIELAISRIAGKTPAFAAYIRDLTDRKFAEERFHFLAESMPQKIFTAKPNGDVDYFNRLWTDFTGLSFDQIKDWGWVQFIHPDDVNENVRRWRHSVNTGEPFQFEHRFRRRDGTYRWHLSRAHAMRNERGDIVMWIGSNTDIDEWKQAGEAAARRSEQLQRLARVSTRLAAAHDVDSVLGVITEESRSLIGAIWRRRASLRARIRPRPSTLCRSPRTTNSGAASIIKNLRLPWTSPPKSSAQTARFE